MKRANRPIGIILLSILGYFLIDGILLYLGIDVSSLVVSFLESIFG